MPAPVTRCRRTSLVAGLLMIHDLYPVPIEERVMQALDTVRPYMESHGGNVELLGIEDGIAKLRLEGSCKSCRASSSTLELAVRQALEEAAPDLLGMDVEGVMEEEEEVTGIALPMANGAPAWHTLDIAPPELPHRHRCRRNVAVRGKRRRNVARLPQFVRELWRRFDGRSARCRLARLSGLRSHILPAGGRQVHGRRPPPAPADPALREAEGIKVAL